MKCDWFLSFFLLIASGFIQFKASVLWLITFAVELLRHSWLLCMWRCQFALHLKVKLARFLGTNILEYASLLFFCRFWASLPRLKQKNYKTKQNKQDKNPVNGFISIKNPTLSPPQKKITFKMSKFDIHLLDIMKFIASVAWKPQNKPFNFTIFHFNFSYFVSVYSYFYC